MIEQIPRQISVASLDRARRIATDVGAYTIHHLALSSSAATTARKTGYMATAEMLADPDRYRQMRERAREAGRRYTWEHETPKLLAQYRTLARRVRDRETALIQS